jgi:hypothetical protein
VTRVHLCAWQRGGVTIASVPPPPARPDSSYKLTTLSDARCGARSLTQAASRARCSKSLSNDVGTLLALRWVGPAVRLSRLKHVSHFVFAGVQHRDNKARRRCAFWTNYVTFLRFVVPASIWISSIHAQSDVVWAAELHFSDQSEGVICSRGWLALFQQRAPCDAPRACRTAHAS